MEPISEGITIGKALGCGAEALKRAGVPDPDIEARYLLEHILGFKRHELFMNSGKALGKKDLSTFTEYIERRSRREPAQYITGTAHFMGMEFKVTRATLIPRPETEILSEEAINTLKNEFRGEGVIIDLCTGSGCVAISIAKELEKARLYATDISGEALDVAKDNARRHGVEAQVSFLQGDLFSPFESVEGGYDIRGKATMMVANPPYVSQAQAGGLEPEVRDFEPHGALFAGGDGLLVIRRIIKASPPYLIKGGYLLMEIGYGQAETVKDIFAKNPYFNHIEIKRDLSGVERIVKARRVKGAP